MMVKCLLLGLALALALSVHIGHAKEIEVTKEWQRIGENDTIPAGMHVRMDMTTGEKWVKQIDEDEEDDPDKLAAAAGGIEAATAVVNGDGSIQVIDDGSNKTEETKPNYDYEMMHRTLSKLPDEEKERMGGIPELPQSSGGESKSRVQREAFEKRMSEIWEKRQIELKEMEDQIVDLPEVLKERIKSIKGYLEDPLSHLKTIDLENDNDNDLHSTGAAPAHFVALLKDLEFLLADIDMTRDFHTLGGWAFLVSLLSDESHDPENKTMSTLSRRMEGNARAVQAHAAWAIGTAVKNTGEFTPLAIEKVPTRDGGTTTAIDAIVDVFCNDYKDTNAWETRTLLAKSVYAIGALLRGNRMAQIYISTSTDIPGRLGEKLRELTIARFSSSTTKLVQRLVSLAGDVVSDVNLHREEDGLDDAVREAIIQSFTSKDWCDSLSTLLTTDTFLPLTVQETLLETVSVVSPYCNWENKVDDFAVAIERMEQEWNNNKDDFDDEHLEELAELVKSASESLGKA